MLRSRAGSPGAQFTCGQRPPAAASSLPTGTNLCSLVIAPPEPRRRRRHLDGGEPAVTTCCAAASLLQLPDGTVLNAPQVATAPATPTSWCPATAAPPVPGVGRLVRPRRALRLLEGVDPTDRGAGDAALAPALNAAGGRLPGTRGVSPPHLVPEHQQARDHRRVRRIFLGGRWHSLGTTKVGQSLWANHLARRARGLHRQSYCGRRPCHQIEGRNRHLISDQLSVDPRSHSRRRRHRRKCQFDGTRAAKA